MAQPAILASKVAIVTGGASLIGVALIGQLVDAGVRVVVGDANESARSEVETLLGTAGLYLCGDVTDDAFLDQLIAAAADGPGKLAHLITAPAIFEDHGYQTSWELWRKALDINMVSAARLTGKAAPLMAAGSSVVYIASVSARRSQPDRMVYNATKAALVMLAQTGAQELAPDGIRVNTVSPGWTWSRNIERRFGSREKADTFAAEFQPLGRMVDPAEVADAVMFLISERASFITGTDLAVDGGYGAIGPEALGQAERKHSPKTADPERS
jgi:NAD(P)-dependent dehydrogenase (short-subunit alcohol dehydrogenase family)